MPPNDITVLSDNRGHSDPTTPLNGAATRHCPFGGRSRSTLPTALVTLAGVKQVFVELSIFSACLIGEKNCRPFHQNYFFFFFIQTSLEIHFH